LIKTEPSSVIEDNFIEQFSVHKLIEVLDLIPDILFWIKDKTGQFKYANHCFLEHHGMTNLNQITNRTDFDFSPAHIAEQFSVDDQKVLQGQEVHDRLEMNSNQSGKISWFATSKRPLYNKDETLIGTYGISRHLEKTSHVLSGMDALKIPVEFIRVNYMRHITLTELAEVTFLSVSALERRFKKHLKKTPKQYMNDVRLENARRLLIESNLPIASIAGECGYNDHSYFSKQFNILFGQLPSSFREKYTT
jgi:AraC-like DNA-binding protein